MLVWLFVLSVAQARGGGHGGSHASAHESAHSEAHEATHEEQAVHPQNGQDIPGLMHVRRATPEEEARMKAQYPTPSPTPGTSESSDGILPVMLIMVGVAFVAFCLLVL